MLLLHGAALAAQGPWVPSQEPNMNGAYTLTNTPKSDVSKFPKHYRDWPGGVKFFDVYSPPIKSLYSQVFWTGLEPVDLPADIVSEFNDSSIAVVGYELDQVYTADDGTEAGVPISVAYNHHFESNMIGKHAAFEKLPPNAPLEEHEKQAGHGHHGGGQRYRVVDRQPGSHVGKPMKNAIQFGAANGGEVRKSFHGFPPGWAQVLESPRQFQVTPMQIDTWHREAMPKSGWKDGVSFVPGPVPKNSLAPTSGPDAIYSGLLECPLSTRLHKIIESTYTLQSHGSCQYTVADDAECFRAASTLLGAVSANKTADDPSLPAGCTVRPQDSDPAEALPVATFNTAKGGGACGGKATGAYGKASSLASLEVSLNTTHATLSLSGPSAVWFGVAFNASSMGDKPWALILDGNGGVAEYQLHDQGVGNKKLDASVSVVSNSVDGGVRSVLLTRPLKGLTDAHFTFSLDGTPSLQMLNAVGSQPAFSYHKEHRPFQLALLPIDVSSCVCAGEPAPFSHAKGMLSYQPTSQPADVGSGALSFPNYCAPQPRADLLHMRNPTCDLRAYVGGQAACHHMWSLLDAEQPIPWADTPLEYRMKFRFWYQRYSPTPTPSHTPIAGYQKWEMGAGPLAPGLGAEFDVPKCAEGVAGCAMGADGYWVHTITANTVGKGRPVAAHFHCHAPTCLSLEVWRNDTGELLCREEPIYGGHGAVEKRFDELGYIAIPPCLWGTAEFGLEAPLNLSGVPLHLVKRSNATYGHHGEMAHPQVYVDYVSPS